MIIEARYLKQTKELPESKELRTLCSLIDGFALDGSKAALLSFSKELSESLNYCDLASQITTLAAGLQQQGVKPGEHFIFLSANSAQWIISALAVIYTGATVVPVDSQQSDEVLLQIVEDCQSKWIFTDEKGSKRLEKLMPDSRCRIVRLDKKESVEALKSSSSPPLKSGLLSIAPADIAVLFYTSGTTGTPKGVPLSHANMLLQLDAISQTDLLRIGDRVLLPLPLFHVYPLNIGLLAPLSMGLTIVLPHSLTGPEIMRSINEGGVTVVIAVPRLLRSLCQSIEAKLNSNKIVAVGFKMMLGYCQWMDSVLNLQPGKILLDPLRQKVAPSLRLFACGGAPLESELARKLRAFGWDLAVGYGLSETSPLLTLRMPNNQDLEGVGTAISGVEVKIEAVKEADVQMDKDAGEILARGANVFAGYLNRPDLNKESFTADGWFRTGDLGLIKNGQLHVIGRASSTIVMEGGEKIQPENIEDNIAKQPGIAEIALLQVEHKLVALVVPDLKATGESDVRNAVASAVKAASVNLASYLQVTEFALTKEALPRTSLGKIKRHELKELFEKARVSEKSHSSGQPSSQSSELSSLDQILLEEPAAAACFDWLKKTFPDQQVGLDTSPQLDLNIDSLEWMNLTLELVDVTGVELSAEAISRVTTVRELLTEIAASGEGGEKAASPQDDPDHYLNDRQREFLKPLSAWQSHLAHFLYRLNSILMRPFNVKLVGYEQLTAKQYVFVPNHASYLDAFALAAAIPYERISNTQWAAWAGIAFGNPLASFLSRISRVFPIEAKQSLVASLALGISVLKAGTNLVWFPEGERTLDGQLLPFKQGLGLLLAKSDVLVVPVFLQGTRNALPPGAFIPKFEPITVILGEPIKPEQLAKEGSGQEAPERIANALHDRVAALASR